MWRYNGHDADNYVCATNNPNELQHQQSHVFEEERAQLTEALTINYNSAGFNLFKHLIELLVFYGYNNDCSFISLYPKFYIHNSSVGLLLL